MRQIFSEADVNEYNEHAFFQRTDCLSGMPPRVSEPDTSVAWDTHIDEEEEETAPSCNEV